MPEGTDRVHIDALIQLDDGSWRSEDWTNLASASYCRDRADQRIGDLRNVCRVTGEPRKDD